MTHQERDELVRDIACRVFAEEASGRHVDLERLLWAAEVLDQLPAGTGTSAVEKPEVVRA